MQRKKAKTSLSLFKVILLILGFIFLVMTIYFVMTYYSIQTSKTKGFQKTNDLVLEMTDLSEINETVRFQEIDTYHIVQGKTTENSDQYIFVPISNPDEDLTIVNQADIINKDEIEKQWSANCDQCQLVAIKPAMMNHTPLWELTYYDASNRYVFDYVTMDDGSEFERIRLQREFK